MLTPQQALAILENVKSETAETQVKVSNTIANASAMWALQSMKRDGKLLEEIAKLNKNYKAILKLLNPSAVTDEAAAAPEGEVAESEAPAGPNGFEGLEGEALNAAMEAATAGMPLNPNAPAPVGMPMPEMPENEEPLVSSEQTTAPAAPAARRAAPPKPSAPAKA